MAEFTLSRVHDYRKVQGAQRLKLVDTNHYVSFKNGDEGPFYVQNGAVWSEGGQKLDPENLPAWFWEQARGIREDRRPTYGLDEVLERANGHAKAEKSEPEPEATSAEPPKMDENFIYYENGQKMWWCPECEVGMPTRKKGVHVMHHRRKKKRV